MNKEARWAAFSQDERDFIQMVILLYLAQHVNDTGAAYLERQFEQFQQNLPSVFYGK